MGRPKQKAVVDKYFVKIHRQDGKSSNFYECKFCKKCYVYNTNQFAEHLLACTCTDEKFNAEKKQIATLFFSPKPNTRSVSALNQVKHREEQCNHDKHLNHIELANENQNLMLNASNSFKFTGGSSTANSSTSKSTTHFNGKHSNTSLVSTTTKSNYDPQLSSTSTSVRLNHRPFIIPPEQDEIWASLARACYASEIPFNFTENKYWIDVFKKIIPNFQLPTQCDLTNSLLDAEYKRIEQKNLKKINNAQVLSLKLGGWYYIKQKPVMNIILMTPEPVVYNLVDCSNETNTEKGMTFIIEEVFRSLSNKTIISVVTDDALDITCSWRVLREKFQGKNVSFYACAVHVLNLVIKDIMEIEIFSLLGNSAIQLCKEFEQSHLLSSLLKKFQNVEAGVQKNKSTLILPNVERMNWVSYVHCFKSIISNKTHLKQVASSSKVIHCFSGNFLLNILDNHHTFLPKVEDLMKMLEPISMWIKKFESKKSTLSDVICAFHEIQIAVYELFSVSTDLMAERQSVSMIIETRKKMVIERIHLAAHMLDPRYIGKYLTKEETFKATQFILSLANHLKINERHISSDLTNYRTQGGLWSNNSVWNYLKVKADGSRMEPLTWWNEICCSSSLATVASAIMQCPPSSVSQEKFSTCEFTKVKKKYQLNDDKTSKLIYVRHNLKLQESRDFHILDSDNVNNLSSIKQEFFPNIESDNEYSIL